MVDITNEELFNSALSDEPITETAAEVTAEEVEASGQPRDDQGRFAPKTEEPEVKPEVKPEAEAQIPSWRLREIREERDTLRAQLAQFQRQSQPVKPAKPDIFEKPDEFVRQSAQELVDPVHAAIAETREGFSRMYAVDKYGEDKVIEAYNALDQAAKTGDHEALAVVARIKNSITPFQDLMKHHEKQSVYTQIGNDPDAWFQKKLESMIGDEKFKSELIAKLNPQGEKPKPVVQLPPSLNRVAAAQAAIEESADTTNESLFRHALS